jgi:hypothetical protein
MDDGKRKELRDLLGTVESAKELDRAAQRERLIERNRHAYRFQELKRAVIVPTLREFMIDLERKGHLTRLRDAAQEKTRLDVQIQAAKARRGAVEFALHSEPGTLRIDYSWGWRLEQEVYPLDQVAPAFVADRVLHLLRGLLEA